MEEPDVGIEPESMDMEAHLKMRMGLPFAPYKPLFFKFPDEVPPLVPPNEVSTCNVCINMSRYVPTKK
jgi:hypothetical protein